MRDKIRPNVILGLLILLGLVVSGFAVLSPEDAKEVLLLAVGGVIGVLTDLLRADQSRKGEIPK